MNNYIKTIFFLFISFNINAQITLSGSVVDKKNNPIIGASVYLENTYDGGFTDERGNYSFETTEKGKQTLIVSYISYKTYKNTEDISKLNGFKITLKQIVNELNSITITAGTFETGDNSKTAVLTPLDVVTTAGAEAGDINSSIKTLPGLQTVGEDGRLFVRGGDASETRVFIDGMRVFKPYGATINNTPTRSRFSAMLFKGIAFSSGGYSSEYGDALSGVLSMNTVDFPNQNKTDINFMSLGLGVGKTKKWKKDAISLSIGYIDLGPYKSLIPDNYKWVKPYRGFSGESVYRHKFKSGMLKFYTGGSISNAIINRYDVNYDQDVDSQIKNKNIYLNSTYKGSINKKLVLFSGVSYSYDKSLFGVENQKKNIVQNGVHIKTKLTHLISDVSKITYGAEFVNQITKIDINGSDIPTINSDQYSVFSEFKYLFSKKLVSKIGLRAEYSGLLDKWNIAPRGSIAYKTGKNSQISIAAGKYFQIPDNNFLYNNILEYENTDQLILNYSYKYKSRILRAELYYKKYNDLLLYNNFSQISNNGYGHAKGFDLFWKDKKTFRFLEYWISYSLLDVKKQYKNFPELAKPNSASTHNLSLVAKYWIGAWNSYPGITYNYGSPRPFNNPNSNKFMAEKTKAYHNLSLTWSYLISRQKILFFSISNILGFKNEYGYEYSSRTNQNGQYRSNLITPPSTRSIFIGFFWTISDDKRANQLDQL